MTAQGLISELLEKGVELKVSAADRLVVDAPKGALTPELRSALSAHKAEILSILQEGQRPEQPVVSSSHDFSASEAGNADDLMPPFRALVAAGDNQEPTKSRGVEDIKSLEEELSQLRVETEGHRAAAKTRRQTVENAQRLEQGRQRKIDEEAARQRAQEERRQIEAEERERAEEDNRRKIVDQQMARAEEELKRTRVMEQQHRAEFEVRLLAQEEARRAEIETRRIVEGERERSRAEQERQRLEAEARERAQEEEVLRRGEMQLKAIEEAIARIHAREEARRRAAEEAARKSDDEARQLAEEEARRKAKAEALRKAEEEARLRARIEAELRAEADARRKVEDEARRQAEEEERRVTEEVARRRAEEEARRLAADEARRRVQEEARRRAEDEEARRVAGEEARRRAEEEALRRAHAEDEARRRHETDAQRKAEEEARQLAELETRIRAEIEAKIRAEEEERFGVQEPPPAKKKSQVASQKIKKADRLAPEPGELEENDHSPATADVTRVTEIAEWIDVSIGRQDRNHAESRSALAAEEFSVIAPRDLDSRFPEFSYDELDGGFQPVSVPESETISAETSAATSQHLSNGSEAERAGIVAELGRGKGDKAFRNITTAFDDQDAEVRTAAARALFEFQNDRVAAFTRALREATPERRKNIGAGIAASGIADEAIGNLTGGTRDETYDAFSLLFLMSKAGEVQPLMSAIEEHPSVEVRLAVVKLLALCGQPSILPSFRRMAVRGSLPPEVRAAVMEAIYQMTSQAPAESTPVG